MKSKKLRAFELIRDAVIDSSMVPPDNSPDILAMAIVEAIEIMTTKAKKGEKTEGAQVWEAYEAAVIARHKFTPARNATVNNQASQLVKRIGLENAIAVVQFYVAQNDAFYVKSMHPLGFCLKDCESLFGRWKTGRTITKKAAEKIESAGATLGASSSYLNRKYAGATIPGGDSK